MNQPNQNQDRLPPHSVEAEQGVLGCILLNGVESLGEVTEALKSVGPEAFYELRHQAIYATLRGMEEAGEGIDLVTLFTRLKDKDLAEKVGGMAYVSSLADSVPSAANLPTYLSVLKEKYLLRCVLRICGESANDVYAASGEDETARVLDSVERQFLEINELRAGAREMGVKEVLQRTIDLLEEYHRGHGQMRGLPTGFDYLDKMLLGLAPGQFVVIAARPGVGKTSIGMNVVEHVAVDIKAPCAVFSLEMTNEELVSRLLFQRARGDYQRFRTGFMENEDFPKLAKAAGEIKKAQLWIDDTSDLTVMEIRAKARRMARQKGIKLVLIDYLQLIRGVAKYNNRNDEVADISKNLKSMAKELKVLVIVLAQLNREVEKERNRMPRLSDLRESGAIEQDADVVCMLYEPKVPEEELAEADWAKWAKRVNCLVAKQRNGPTGNVELLFRKESMRFEPYLRTESRPAPRVVSNAMPSNEELGLP